MFAPYLARIALLAALVFSQALYAGHALQHGNDQQADCQVCLQASTGHGALPCQPPTPAINAAPSGPMLQVVEPGYRTTLSVSHPSRAPPAHPL